MSQNITISALIMLFAFTQGTETAAQTMLYATGCHDGTALEAAMEKDGQRPVFLGKRLAIGGTYPGNVFTVNESGFGFNVERDPETRRLCVRATFRDVRLNSPDNPNIPSWGRTIKPNKGIDVQKAYNPENGGRLLLHARTYTISSSGVQVPGKAIVVMAQPMSKRASVWSVDRDDLPDGSFSMVEFGIVSTNFDRLLLLGFGSDKSR
jgi:hypothetical protein